LLALPYTNTPALAARLTDTLPADVGGRLAIWRETWAMARDFLAIGIGVGAFERGMLVYQQGSRVMFINHAHNEYLQVLTEGGLLIAFAVVAAIVAGASLVVQRLRSDSVRTFWIRTGALSGLIGVGMQSLWDTALRMPANGVLFAIVAAIALHAPSVRRSDRGKSPDERRPHTNVPVET
jgi:O-antigen ligase